MTGRSDSSERSTGRGMGLALVLAVVSFAVVAAAVLVFSDSSRWLRLAVVAALWAALLAAFAAARYRNQAVERAEREEELQRVYELELERECAARREYELEVEAETRRQLEDEARNELDELRSELRTLRENLEALLGGEVLVERVALRAEATRMRALDQARVMGTIASDGREGRVITATTEEHRRKLAPAQAQVRPQPVRADAAHTQVMAKDSARRVESGRPQPLRNEPTRPQRPQPAQRPEPTRSAPQRRDQHMQPAAVMPEVVEAWPASRSAQPAATTVMPPVTDTESTEVHRRAPVQPARTPRPGDSGRMATTPARPQRPEPQVISRPPVREPQVDTRPPVRTQEAPEPRVEIRRPEPEVTKPEVQEPEAKAPEVRSEPVKPDAPALSSLKESFSRPEPEPEPEYVEPVRSTGRRHRGDSEPSWMEKLAASKREEEAPKPPARPKVDVNAEWAAQDEQPRHRDTSSSTGRRHRAEGAPTWDAGSWSSELSDPEPSEGQHSSRGGLSVSELLAANGVNATPRRRRRRADD